MCCMYSWQCTVSCLNQYHETVGEALNDTACRVACGAMETYCEGASLQTPANLPLQIAVLVSLIIAAVIIFLQMRRT